LFLYTNFISFIYIPVVIYFIYKMIITFENDLKNEKILEKIKKETNWLKHLIYLGIVVTTLGLISAIIGIKFNMKESFYAYPFFISTSVWIYWIGYAGIRRSSSHLKIEKINYSSTSQNKNLTAFDKINTYILTNKIYLNSDVNRDIVAEEFEISNGYLSQLINLHTQGNFSDYINKLRVESSKKNY